MLWRLSSSVVAFSIAMTTSSNSFFSASLKSSFKLALIFSKSSDDSSEESEESEESLADAFVGGGDVVIDVSGLVVTSLSRGIRAENTLN